MTSNLLPAAKHDIHDIRGVGAENEPSMALVMNITHNTQSISQLTKDTLALVMAGGRGTRLMQLTAGRTKPAVSFGGKFRIVDFTLSNCINSGIRRIGVMTQYRSHSLIRHLQKGWSFLRGELGEAVELLPAEQCIEDTSWYAGTANAVYQNLEFIRRHQPAYVLVLAGDHIYKMDYGRMLAQHVRTGAKVTVGCLQVPLQEASNCGVIRMDENSRVVNFVEKPERPTAMQGNPDAALASMGIYVFDTQFLLDWLTHDSSEHGTCHDFGKDVIPSVIRRKCDVYAYPFTDLYDPDKPGYWRDVGTVDSYWRGNMELTDVIPELNLYDQNWPVWTYQPQLPPAKFVFDEPRRRGSAIDALVSGGCIVSGASVRRSVLSSGVHISDASRIEQSLLHPNVLVGRNCRINRAIIDEDCVIPDGTAIGIDLDHDRALYHVSEGGITLVTADMLTP